ncbi:hypothetical protein BXZ70DRAFT_1077240 [Cristinia sonorae]|uniref:F-box domain-containing protein n=1 Tax=Cristinia sonorae TaxID=1940300 RepID=A0A8K0UNT4_9AGAR|nr:hypothetical protein BXZ70DRAFT_1077240 [Cristinia sonorae]
MPKAKPVRKPHHPTTSESESDPPNPHYLDRLPLEILAEILLHTASPRDVLSVARCSKFLCATLVNNPATTYIWKHLRGKFHRVPDPTPNWTEASYAAFIFGPSTCESCGKTITKYPYSVALRLRLCGVDKPTEPQRCLERWLKTHSFILNPLRVDSRYRVIMQHIPRLESVIYTVPNMNSLEGHIARKKDWEEATDGLNKALLEGREAEFQRGLSKKWQNRATIEAHCNQLVIWRMMRNREALKLKEDNDRMTKTLAEREGWPYWDLKISPAFATLLRCKTISEEELTSNDLESIRSALEPQLIRTKENRERRMEETAYAQARGAVAKYHENLSSSSSSGGILPPLADFRLLHSIQMVLHQPSATKMLTSKQLDGPIAQEVGRWVQKAREGLAGVLGFGEWKTASTSTVHVAERVNARFLCVRCEEKGGGSRWEDPGMNFKEACRHECACLSKRQRAKHVWAVENFKPDRQAIDAVNQALKSSNTNPAGTDAESYMHGLGARIIHLRTYDHTLTHSPSSKFRHSKRHETIQVEVVTSEEAQVLLRGKSFERDSALRLRLGLGKEKQLRDKPIFACRHCPGRPFPIPTAEDVQEVNGTGAALEAGHQGDAEAEAPASRSEGPAPAPSSAKTGGERERVDGDQGYRFVYTFNGLRSHVKANVLLSCMMSSAAIASPFTAEFEFSVSSGVRPTSSVHVQAAAVAGTSAPDSRRVES